MILSTDINLIAVLAMAALQMGLGAFWYSPLGCGKYWMRIMESAGHDMKDCDKGMGMGCAYGLTALGNILVALVMAEVVYMFDVADFLPGVGVGLIMWLGFVVPSTFSTVVFEKRKWQLYAIYAAYQLVALGLIGGILAVWQ